MFLAIKTITRINEAIEADNGSSYRGWLKKVLPHINDAYNEEDDPLRSHLGASIIGTECSRAIWYSFRWAEASKFNGKMLRLFNRGHLEEGRFIAALLAAGIDIYQQDINGNQFRVSFYGGHFGGSCDGIAYDIPDFVDVGYTRPALLEFKTHNEESFAKLRKSGVKVSKSEHYSQMQIYMKGLRLDAALYLSVNKNTDELYGELINFDDRYAQKIVDKAISIIKSDSPPMRINESASWYQCKYCTFAKICHHGGDMLKNCRTCRHSVPHNMGSWICGLHGHELSKQEQKAACSEYKRLV